MHAVPKILPFSVAQARFSRLAFSKNLLDIPEALVLSRKTMFSAQMGLVSVHRVTHTVIHSNSEYCASVYQPTNHFLSAEQNSRAHAYRPYCLYFLLLFYSRASRIPRAHNRILRDSCHRVCLTTIDLRSPET